MAELNCVMYREGGTGAPELDSELLSTGHIRIAACVENYRDLVNAIEAHHPELLVAVLGDESETSLESLSALGDLPFSLVCSGSASQGDLILRSMRLGAAEYLPFEHDEEELMNLVERLTLVPAIHANPSQPTRASIVTVLGVKGGAGSTVGAGSVDGAGAASGAAANSGVPTGETVVTPEMEAPGGGKILAGSIAVSLESLQELFQGFDAASIMLMMMIMMAAEQSDEEQGGAGMGFLLGMAVAGSLSQQDGSGNETGGAVEASSAGTGANLDVSA